MADRKTISRDQQRGPTFLLVLLVIVILALAAFLILRPRGSDATNPKNPAAPAASQ